MQILCCTLVVLSQIRLTYFYKAHGFTGTISLSVHLLNVDF